MDNTMTREQMQAAEVEGVEQDQYLAWCEEFGREPMDTRLDDDDYAAWVAEAEHQEMLLEMDMEERYFDSWED